MSEVIPASITAAFKAWHVNNGYYEPDGDKTHWGIFWEPLQVDLPPSAKPHCCYGNLIAFYDRSGNKLLADFVQHYDFINTYPHLLHVGGKWREVVNGRCENLDGQWYMRWGMADNTRWAMLLNGET